MKERPYGLLILVLIFSGFALFFNLGGRTLENKDYLKYAEVGREILETGDWTVLHENGNIYVQKPPLHFWKIAASYKLMGVSPRSSRIPSAVMAFIGVVATMLFAWKLTGRELTGVLSSMVLLSSYGFFFFSRRTRIDIEFSVLFAISLMLFYLATVHERKKALLLSLFWFSTGLLFMDKGPVCFMNLLPATTFLIVMKRKGQTIPIKTLIATSPLIAVPVVPWIIKLMSHPEFHSYLNKLEASKIATRNAGLFYYVPELIAKFAPGILFLPCITTIKKTSASKEKASDLFTFLMTWILTYFIAINLTHVKNHRYLLPMFAPLSILVGWGLDLSIERGFYRRFIKATEGAFIALYIGCFLASPFVAFKLFKTIPANLILLSFIPIALILKLRKSKMAILIPFLGAIFIYLHMGVMDTLNNTRSSEVRRLYEVLNENGIKNPDSLCFLGGCGRIREVLSFYYNRLITCTSSPDEANRFKAVIVEGEKVPSFKLSPTKIITLNMKKGRTHTLHILLFGGAK